MICRRRILGVFTAVLLSGGLVAGCLHVQDGQPAGAQRPSVEERDGGSGMSSDDGTTGGGMRGM